MRTKLDALLESIHPSRTLDEVDSRADDAVNSFPQRAAMITAWDVFRDCLIRFMIHTETRLLCLKTYPGASSDFLWGRCVRWLIAEYGRNGEKAAFEMARTGAEAGLRSVLSALARRIAQDCAENEISGRILSFWNSLSVDERLDTASEYLAKYGHLLPSELTEGSAARVRAELPKWLERYPHLLRQLGRVGRG